MVTKFSCFLKAISFHFQSDDQRDGIWRRATQDSSLRSRPQRSVLDQPQGIAVPAGKNLKVYHLHKIFNHQLKGNDQTS
jgi:hypothetical protein